MNLQCMTKIKDFLLEIYTSAPYKRQTLLRNLYNFVQFFEPFVIKDYN
jgi:hypothetical protein